MATVEISTEYITLGQLLKDAGIIDSGGQAKWFLAENRVLVNGEEDSRRGRTLRAGDTATLPDNTVITVVQAG